MICYDDDYFIHRYDPDLASYEIPTPIEYFKYVIFIS